MFFPHLAKHGLGQTWFGQTWSWPNLVWPNLVTKLGQTWILKKLVSPGEGKVGNVGATTNGKAGGQTSSPWWLGTPRKALTRTGQIGTSTKLFSAGREGISTFSRKSSWRLSASICQPKRGWVRSSSSVARLLEPSLPKREGGNQTNGELLH